MNARSEMFFLVLTQSRSYQTSEGPLSTDLQNLIYPCVLFPEELETLTMINEGKEQEKVEDPISS